METKNCILTEKLEMYVKEFYNMNEIEMPKELILAFSKITEKQYEQYTEIILENLTE